MEDIAFMNEGMGSALIISKSRKPFDSIKLFG
jgi:hypothetical protein